MPYVEYITAAAMVIFTIAEWIHTRRVKKIGVLAFGEKARPFAWTMIAPCGRIAAVGLLTWGLVTLYFIDPKVHKGEEIPDSKKKHLVMLLDVSPSMDLKDAGPQGNMTRRERAAELMTSFFQRVIVDDYKISVIAVYNGSKPVVIDSKDLEIVRHILEDLPMYFAFKSGKTKLYSGLEEAVKISKGWNPRSTTLLMLSDGDTVPATGMPRMPASIKNVLIVGVGDSRAGKFIDGHQSRQDSSTLRSMAVRLKGIYHDGNKNHISSTTIADLTQSKTQEKFDEMGKREYALMAIGVGAGILSILPILLFYLGTFWKPGVRVAAGAGSQVETYQSSSTG